MGIMKKILENNRGKQIKGVSFVYEGDEVIAMLERMRKAKEIKKKRDKKRSTKGINTGAEVCA